MPSIIADTFASNVSSVFTPVRLVSKINSVGDPSELNDLLGLEEISFLEAGLLEPKLIQNREQ